MEAAKAEKVALEEYKLNEISSFFGAEPEELTEQLQDADVAIQAQTKAVGEVAGELDATGDIEDAEVADSLRNESSGWQFASYQGDSYAAAAGFRSYLDERQAASQTQYNSHGEALNQAKQWAAEYVRAHGLMGKSKVERMFFANTLAGTMMQETKNFASGQTAKRIQADGEARDNSVAAGVAKAIQSNASPAAVWQQGTLGYGRGSVGGSKAISAIITAATQTGDVEFLEELKLVPKIPNQPNGEKLGQTYYTQLENAIVKAQETRKRLNTEKVLDINNNLYQELNKPENQDPSVRRDLIREAATELSRIPGSEKAAQELLDNVKTLDDPTMSAFVVEEIKDQIKEGSITSVEAFENNPSLSREDREALTAYLNENSPGIPNNAEVQKILDNAIEGVMGKIEADLGITKDLSGNINYGSAGIDNYGVNQIKTAVELQQARIAKEVMSANRDKSPREQANLVDKALREWYQTNVVNPDGKFNLAVQEQPGTLGSAVDNNKRRTQKVKDLIASPVYMMRTDSSNSSKKAFQSQHLNKTEGVINDEEKEVFQQYRNDTIYTQEAQKAFSDTYQQTGKFSDDLIKTAEKLGYSPLQLLNLQNSAHGFPQVYYSSSGQGLEGPMSPGAARNVFLASGLSSEASTYLATNNSMTPQEGEQLMQNLNEAGLSPVFTSSYSTDRQRTSALAAVKPTNAVERAALDAIGYWESDSVGGYNAVNQIGRDGGHSTEGFSGDYNDLGQRNLTEMSVAEIMDLQARRPGMSDAEWIAQGRLHAVGRYQFIGSTFAEVVRRMGIPGTAIFTPALQDQMALWLLRNSVNGIGQWVGPNTNATPQQRSAINAARNS